MARLKVIGILLTLALVAGATSATVRAGGSFDSYILPGENVYPEGITYQQSTGNFYVTSTTDGTIFRGNINDGAAQVFLPGGQDGRTTAVGLKVDDRNRLFVAGGSTGKLFVYNVADGGLIAQFDTGSSPTFINDVALTPNGDAYFTDSQSPYLYRIFTNGSGQLQYERFLDFTGTPLVYTQGFNVNGIAASSNGRYLVAVQSNTGKLFRIEIATKTVSEITTGGYAFNNGDGLLLQGSTLYVVRNMQELVVRVQLNGQLTSGRVVNSYTDPLFQYPTTIARAGGTLLVVNSQFDKRAPGQTPVTPFTVARVRVP